MKQKNDDGMAWYYYAESLFKLGKREDAANAANKRPELHADFLSGWYLGIRSHQLPGKVNANEAATFMYQIGDTNFNSPSHHGTADERLAAFGGGFQISINSGANVSLKTAFNEGLKQFSL